MYSELRKYHHQALKQIKPLLKYVLCKPRSSNHPSAHKSQLCNLNINLGPGVDPSHLSRRFDHPSFASLALAVPSCVHCRSTLPLIGLFSFHCLCFLFGSVSIRVLYNLSFWVNGIVVWDYFNYFASSVNLWWVWRLLNKKIKLRRCVLKWLYKTKALKRQPVSVSLQYLCFVVVVLALLKPNYATTCQIYYFFYRLYSFYYEMVMLRFGRKRKSYYYLLSLIFWGHQKSKVSKLVFSHRPLYLPIRTVVTLGNFSVSSNLIAATNTSCLRFLAQECMLFLYHLPTTKTHVTVPQDDDKTPDVNRNYVCVMDLGLFELSLRMEDKGNGVSLNPCYVLLDVKIHFQNYLILKAWYSPIFTEKLVLIFILEAWLVTDPAEAVL